MTVDVNKNNWMQKPLAIVGMACRLPGGDDLESFWQLLKNGGNGIDRLPGAFLDRKLYFAPEKGVRGKSYSEIGGLIADRPLDWNIMPVGHEAANNWDACHLILCEVAARACIHAGYDPRNLPERRTGVYIGHSGGSTKGGELAYRTLLPEYIDLLEDLAPWQDLDNDTRRSIRQELHKRLRDSRPGRYAQGGPMVDAGYAAGLISQAFELSGPHMVVDAACASSLVALALSAAALQSGQIEMALVGGASMNKVDSLILFSHAQSCSAEGSCPFDGAADGLISSEGYVVFVLKTLEKALASGDRIQAVIRGIGVSSDGRGRSLWAPRKEGQEKAIERAYFDDVTPDSVQLVEAHATSTQVGDATEMEALANFYRQHVQPEQRIPVGSVKSNIGHTLESAGMAGLVKVVMAIHHGAIPPSINVTHLNETIPWNEIPLFVPRQCQPWPALPEGRPRRAAVNAFGIGGLNVHVVVDQYQPQIHDRLSVPSTKVLSQPIAVVGRGLVIPGALNVSGLAAMISGHLSALTSPPPDRWRMPYSVAASNDGPSGRPSGEIDICGGFINDFAYDWRKHKVPPKQIAQANPLQFMLLEAAEQALEEGRYLDKAWNRQRAAVVVGSVFGGDFGNALYAGLRLPEFRATLVDLMMKNGLSRASSAALADLYEDHFLKRHPALLDETGSFTSSTLASRLSKTFDLMGGAMAIDSGDASGLAALDASINLLRSGTVDHVLCATGQRAMDRASLERLALHGRLRSSPSQVVPAEGVALVLLKRLDQAQADGDKILATVYDVSASVDTQSLERGLQSARHSLRLPIELAKSLNGPDLRQSCFASRAMSRSGNLQAAQGIVDLIECSLDGDQANDVKPAKLIAQHTYSGLQYCAAVIPGPPKPPGSSTVTPAKPLRHDVVMKDEEPTIRILRFGGNDCLQLIGKLTEVQAGTWEDACRKSLSFFHPGHSWRAALVVSKDTYQSKLAMLAGQVGNSASDTPMAEQGLFWSSPQQRVGKVAWLFPGQGSQYPGMLRELVASNPTASRSLAEFDQALRNTGQPTFAELAWGESSQLGENVWHTQASMLIADATIAACMKASSCVPDLVGGHSYGEFAAIHAAGCWDAATALKATWFRCQSILQNVPIACGMLSIQADWQTVQVLIDSQRVPVYISHRNSVDQTVVGGQRSSVEQFAKRLHDEGIASRILAVPTAFHTPVLAAAQRPFGQALASIALGPPRIPLLSSVTCRYVADPEEMRTNLVTQLASPLDFIGFTNRLISDGVRLVIEVGPQQIVTRLIRQIAGPRILAIGSDNLNRGTCLQLLVAQACTEVMRVDAELNAFQTRPRIESPTQASLATAPEPTIHFDATERRRERMRQSTLTNGVKTNKSISSPSTNPPVHFDASHSRRDRNRHQSRPEPETGTPIAGTPSTAAPIPAALIASASITGARTDTASDHEETTRIIESFLIDFVVEQTGYPAEIIELDWNIEADLGIDSIKKAQLFGELREYFDLESYRDFSLDRFHTLRDIVVLLVGTPGKGDWLDRKRGHESAMTSRVVSSAIEPSLIEVESEIADELAHPAQHDDTGIRQRLQKFLIDFVVEQTGYPAEIVDLDADMEADLGIDSIKKAQLFGELREMFPVPNGNAAQGQRPSLADYQTLRAVLDLLVSSQSERPSEASFAEANPNLTSKRRVDEEPVIRKLVPLAETVSRPHEAGEANGFGLPSCEFRQPNLVSATYRQAIHQNLHAMVSRTQSWSDVERQLPLLPQWYDATLKAFSQAIDGPESSLKALDRCLRNQTHWRPIANHSHKLLEKGAIASELTDTELLKPVLEYCVPAWMISGGGVPIATHDRYLESITLLELATPGCALPMTRLNANGLLLAAGLSNPKGTAGPSSDEQTIVALGIWIRTQAEHNSSSLDFETAARALKLPSDWWVMRVEGDTAERTTITSHDGVIVFEKGSLLATSHSRAFEPPCVARLMLDTQRHQWTLESQLQTGPYAPLRTTLVVKRPSTAADKNGADSELEIVGADDCEASDCEASDCEVSDSEICNREVSDSEVTQRYILRMVPAPQLVANARRPQWSGAALIVGENPVATQLEARLRGLEVPVLRWAGTDDPMELAQRFDQLDNSKSIRHLFLTTACDVDARSTLDGDAWQRRRNRSLMSSYWLCQRWHQKVVSSGWLDDTSLVAITTMGGDFGLSGHPHSVEGGGLCGLLKSILIESWVQGFRTFPIKVLDTHHTDSPAQVVDSIWRELSIPSFDLEVAYRNGERHVIRAIARSLPQLPSASSTAPTSGSRISTKATWVCTGGARGITAFVAEHLAKRYDLVLHLLGVSPTPTIDSSWQSLDEQGMRALKVQVMTSARAAGNSPVTTWQDTEKAIEIDRNLRHFRELGIEVHYHQCDVSNRQQVAQVLHRVREISGPIRGILHGAGVGKDARFDRKQSEKVHQCIGAKVDGAWSLIEATWNDPLEVFVGFGSISGRFGANGHTDYSLANDMLCKQMDWLRGARPEVHAVGFHWHAWGDIGMATKPETRLALEMIQMQFMPAAEGLMHLIRELESESRESEVLITDDRYYRLFYSPDTRVDARGRRTEHLPPATPLLEEVNQPGELAEPSKRYKDSHSTHIHFARLQPAKDPFLLEHRLDDRPLLPIVIGTELLLEAARAHLGHSQTLNLRDVRAVQGLRFYSENSLRIKVVTCLRDDGAVACELRSDFHARDGRLVQRDRVNLVGIAQVQNESALNDITRVEVDARHDPWQRAIYPSAGGKFYAGTALQRLRGFALSGDCLIGKIIAPALIELAGGSRDVRGWQLPSAAVDSCLFAAGILAWQRVAPGSALPISFGEIAVGRAARPGEACEVHVRLQSALDGQSTTGQAAFDLTLFGVNGDVLVNMRDYRVAWLTDAVPTETAPSVSITS